MKFKSDIEVQAGLRDGSNDIGTSGQILSSTGSQTNWIDPEAKLVVIECKNTSGSTISKGTPVYQTGTVGATDVIEIDAADASDEDKMAAIGLLQTDLANNAFGKVVITGELLNITTSPIDGVTPVTGDTIYVKSGGGLTLTKPTGVNFIQNIGLVGKVSGGSAGSITVSSIMRSNDVPTPLYIDHTNQRLGIGATDPLRKLHVVGNFAVNAATNEYYGVNITGGEGSNPTILIGDWHNSSANISWDSSSNFLRIDAQHSTSGAPIVFSGNDAAIEYMRITSSGNVGIGTTSPGAKLHVNSENSQGTLIISRGGNNLAATNNVGSITFPADYNGTPINYAEIKAYANALSGVRGSLDFNVKSTSGTVLTGMTVYGTSSGVNVGIGTTSPRTKMHVDSSTAFSLTDGSADTLLLTNDSTVSAIGAIGPSIGFGNMNNNNRTSAIAAVRTGGDHDNMGLAFFTHPSDSGDETVVQKMTITHEGNVGIGTTSPTAPLDVNGVIRSRGGSYAADVDTKTDVGLVIPENYFIYTADGSSYLRKLIGKTSDIITIGEAGTSLIDGINLVPGTAGGYVQIFNNSSIAAKFVDGKLGIGTTSPEAKLHVDSENLGTTNNNTTTQAIFSAVNANASKLYIQDYRTADGSDWTTSGKRIQEKIDSTWMGYVQFNGDSNNGGVSFGTGTNSTQGNVAERMRITSGGNVGIGTTSPSRLLDVDGVQGWSLNNAEVAYLNPTSTGTDFALKTSGTTVIRLDGRPNADSFINNGGNVGIGTTSPSEKLHVRGSVNNDDVAIYIHNAFDDNLATSNPTSALLLTAASNNAYLRLHGAPANTAAKHQIDLGSTAASSFLTFSPSSTERMRIASSGYIGIGTTSPGAKLEVSSSGADGVLISKDKGTTSNSGRLFFETDTVSEGFSFLNSNGLMTIRSQAQAGATSGNVRVAINGSGNSKRKTCGKWRFWYTRAIVYKYRNSCCDRIWGS
jgi:hypothetical protein